MKRCTTCQQNLPLDRFYKEARAVDGLRSQCKDCTAETGMSRWLGNRLALIEKLGGVCARCGESDHRVLEIDHVNGGGAREHAEGIRTGSPRYIRRVAENPEHFQVLCANCHRIKTWEDRERKRGRSYPDPATEATRAESRARQFSSEAQRAKALRREAMKRANDDGLCSHCKTNPRSRHHSWCTPCHSEARRERERHKHQDP